jgi:hypothetical protein
LGFEKLGYGEIARVFGLRAVALHDQLLPVVGAQNRELGDVLVRIGDDRPKQVFKAREQPGDGFVMEQIYVVFAGSAPAFGPLDHEEVEVVERAGRARRQVDE